MLPVIMILIAPVLGVTSILVEASLVNVMTLISYLTLGFISPLLGLVLGKV
jgi:hypothetical protein